MEISKILMDMVDKAAGGGFLVIIVSVLFLVAGFIMLIKGADMFVDGAPKVAVKLKGPPIVIGL